MLFRSLDSIHGVAGTAIYHTCIVSRDLRVSHAAFLLRRWGINNIEGRILQARYSGKQLVNSGKFVNLLLLVVNSGKQLVELVSLLLLLSPLCSRSPSVTFNVFGKRKPPRCLAKASCSSSVFGIPEDQCQQVFLSIEMDSRCGGRTRGVGFFEVTEV